MENDMTMGEILEREKQMFFEAEAKYGDFFRNAAAFNGLLQGFIKGVRQRKAMIFMMFLSQVRKHHTLALFSVVRLHHIQATLNLRQTLEAGANAAYALANPNPEDFAVADDRGILDATQELTKRRYKWLEENYPNGSTAIKNMKKNFNKSCAHSNIIFVHKNFSITKNGKRIKFEMPFFDIEDEYLVKTDLWTVGNIAMGLMDLFYGINESCNLLTFSDPFVKNLRDLGKENDRLKAEMMQHPRFIRAANLGQSATPPRRHGN